MVESGNIFRMGTISYQGAINKGHDNFVGGCGSINMNVEVIFCLGACLVSAVF